MFRFSIFVLCLFLCATAGYIAIFWALHLSTSMTPKDYQRYCYNFQTGKYDECRDTFSQRGIDV